MIVAVLIPILAFCIPAKAELSGTEYFPPISDILGDAEDGLPANSGDFRDALTDKPTFASDVRLLNALSKSSKKGALGRLGKKGNAKAIPYLGAVLLRANENPQVRASAAMALGRVADWRVLSYLEQGLAEESKEIRFASTLALGKVQTLAAIRIIEEKSLNDPHWWVRFAAVVALGETASPSAVPALENQFHTATIWQLRQQAVASLGRIGSNRAVEVLGQALRDADPAVRSTAARALGEIGGQASMDLLHSAYQDEQTPIARGMIARSLKKVKGEY